MRYSLQKFRTCKNIFRHHSYCKGKNGYLWSFVYRCLTRPDTDEPTGTSPDLEFPFLSKLLSHLATRNPGNWWTILAVDALFRGRGWVGRFELATGVGEWERGEQHGDARRGKKQFANHFFWKWGLTLSSPSVGKYSAVGRKRYGRVIETQVKLT